MEKSQGPVVMTPEGETLSMEIADSPQEHAKGLMFRQHLGKNAGMIFVYEAPRPMAFWMKNTLIPLDILFLDATGTITTVHHMTPCPPEEKICPTYPSQGSAQYAVEINAGRAEELGLSVGDQLSLRLSNP